MASAAVARTHNQVKLHRCVARWMTSWAAFLLGLATMGGIWYGCYWLVKSYAPAESLDYFRWGAYSSLGIGVFLLVFNEPLVKLATGARWIRKREQYPALWDAVERVTPWQARPRPRIYLIPSDGMNAISFGWGLPLLSAVGATEGLVRNLNQEELEAVMAHEIGHVLNKDILISSAMAVTTMMMATTGWLLLRLGPYGGGGRSSRSKGSGALVILIIVGVGLVMYVFGRLFGLVLQAFVSRQREYAADATSAKIMGSSRPLISALQKVVGYPDIGSRAVGAAAGFLCTADPEPSDVMATHPSLDRRIEALERLEI